MMKPLMTQPFPRLLGEYQANHNHLSMSLNLPSTRMISIIKKLTTYQFPNRLPHRINGVEKIPWEQS
ncbi:MAG TPA: hypothetical protein P5032_14235, partial [Candidatus Competibacter sp.]|nr:hypothetical protein [Candidatus Competibacteraceae bacterium]HRW66875.1 hypothetical protein [Candidatus Competibacter sp.]